MNKLERILLKISGKSDGKSLTPRTVEEKLLNEMRSLPVATNGDEGKVPTVGEGDEYLLSYLQEYPGILIVTTTFDNGSSAYSTASKNYSQIHTAFANGKIPMLEVDGTLSGTLIYYGDVDTANDQTFGFSRFNGSTLTVDSNGQVSPGK